MGHGGDPAAVAPPEIDQNIQRPAVMADRDQALDLLRAGLIGATFNGTRRHWNIQEKT
jgi:hypothetical protein